MWMIATADLSEFIPISRTGAQRTTVDVSSRGIPRLFTSRDSAAKALGHWFKGPYIGHCEEGGWYYSEDTDHNRKLVWEGLLAPREVTLCLK